jgi:hypothetical protein
MGFITWVSENWFEVVQTTGIIAGLFFTAISFRTENRSRLVVNQITITRNHRELRSIYQNTPALARVLERDVDLRNAPVTRHEEIFVTLLIHHLGYSLRAIKSGFMPPFKGMEADVQAFFALPIPATIWQMVRPLQNPELVAFVEDCMRNTRVASRELN